MLNLQIIFNIQNNKTKENSFQAYRKFKLYLGKKLDNTVSVQVLYTYYRQQSILIVHIRTYIVHIYICMCIRIQNLFLFSKTKSRKINLIMKTYLYSVTKQYIPPDNFKQWNNAVKLYNVSTFLIYGKTCDFSKICIYTPTPISVRGKKIL